MSEDYASIVIIKRTGADGPRFPLRRSDCLFGRDTTCDLRVQLPGVALEHAKVSRSENNKFYLENLTDSETRINGDPMKESVGLSNMDVFSIAGRSFRFECEQPKRMSLGKKRSSLNNPAIGRLVSPLKEANRIVKDSPRNPVQRRASLRESLGKLRRSSTAFQEVQEPVERTPEKVNEQPNLPLPRRASLRESLGNLRRSSVALLEAEEPLEIEKTEEDFLPVSRRSSLRESIGGLKRSSVSLQEVEEPLTNTPKEEQAFVGMVNSAVSNSKANTPLSTRKLRKRVSFGPKLSPEHFDKTLPVSTPIKKGSNPRRLSAPLSKPCISPARRRYSVATPSFVSRIEEEVEESDEASDEEEHPVKPDSPAVEIVEVFQTDRPRMATPLRDEIKQGKQLRGKDKKMATALKNAIKQGFRLKASKNKMHTPLREEIRAGRKLKPTRKRLGTPVRKAIESRPKLRTTRMRMSTPLREEIETRPALRETKKVMAESLQDEIKSGRKFLKIKRRMKSEVQDEIVAGKELNQTKKKMATELQAEITKGVQLRPTKKRMPTMLQDEIKAGVNLSKTKQSLKTPLRQEIETGVNLRKTKRRMGTLLQDEIRSGVELSKTKQSLKTPLRKEIESGLDLRKTKRRMATMLQDEIKSGIELSKTKQSLKTPLKKEIQAGINLRKTKRRMPTMLQDEIKSGIELSKTKQSLKTPLRKEIETGVDLRKTKRRMATMLQDEIKSGIELSKTKQSLKTPLRKEIESGMKLRPTKPKEEKQPDMSSKTPKRRFSSIDDNPTQSARKKMKTPLKTPQRAGFFPSTRSKTRSVSRRRKSTKKPSYAEIVKRQKLVAKRRMSTKSVLNFEAEQKASSTSNQNTKPKSTTTATEKIKRKSKTPSRRKSLAKNAKVFDGKTGGEWNVVVNKRKILRIKRQRAVKLQQQQNDERRIGTRSSSSDEIFYDIAQLMKTPNVKQNQEPDIEGVAELFEAFEMASPIAATGTPSLRRTSDRVSVVTPLSVDKTPSLRMKESANDVVVPLQLSSTPSLRKCTDVLTVVSAEEPQLTPSLRRVSETLTVAFADEGKLTPPLRRRSNNLTVVAAETPKHTPSLRRAGTAEKVVLSSPLHVTVTPSLKKSSAAVVVETTPAQETSTTIPTEIVKSGSTPKIVAVVSPFPAVQPTSYAPQLASPLAEPTPLEMVTAPVTSEHPAPKEETQSSEDLSSELPDEKQTTSKRHTRSVKRKVQPDSLPPTKRPRRATSRNTAAKVGEEKVESKDVPVGDAVAPKDQIPKRTSARSAKQQRAALDTKVNVQKKIAEVVVLEQEEAEGEAPKIKRSTRASRNRPIQPTPSLPEVVPSLTQPPPPEMKPSPTMIEPLLQMEPILFAVDLRSNPVKKSEELSKSKTTRSTRSKQNVEPDTLETTTRTRRTTAHNNNTDTDVDKKSESPSEVSNGRRSTRSRKTDDKNTVASGSRVRRGTRERSQQPSVDESEKMVEEAETKPERNTRSKRGKSASGKGKTETRGKANPTSKVATRSGKSKNVPGIPETPQPLRFTRTQLEPIVEVPTPLPTPASSLRGSASKKLFVLAENSSSRSGRNITTVVEEQAQLNDEISKSNAASKLRRKRAAPEGKVDEKNEASKEENAPSKKRVTRSKRDNDVVAIEASLPSSKRQRKESAERDEKKDDEETKKRVTRRKRGAQEKKVVEEITISNVKSTRRNKAAVKEVEILEETVVKYTRTTRQKGKLVREENGSPQAPVEKGRRTRKGSSSQTTEESSGRKTRGKRATVKESENVEIPVEKNAKGGRRQAKGSRKTPEKVTELVPRVTRSRRGAQ